MFDSEPIPIVESNHDWDSFEFLPFAEGSEHPNLPENDAKKNEISNIECFFSGILSDLNELDLTEKKTNTIINLFIDTIKSVNRLNKVLVADLNGLTVTEVRNRIFYCWSQFKK